ncbi:MAG TPA: ankyrin repeat domain-containing protein [Kofleriaceae bacterium]
MIRAGDLAALDKLLADDPAAASQRIVDAKGVVRFPLHVVVEWPGYYPNSPAIVARLVAAGADPSAPHENAWHSETALHGAASNDDHHVAEALIDAGANLEAIGGSIAKGTPLDNAVAYGCWNVAHCLVARGARVDKLWHAAGVGLLARLDELLVAATQTEIDDAFWQACHGGQRRAAERLLAAGASLDHVPWHTKETPLGAARTHATQRDLLATWLGERGAK